MKLIGNIKNNRYVILCMKKGYVACQNFINYKISYTGKGNNEKGQTELWTGYFYFWSISL